MLVSGRGSNLQALIDAVADGRLDATVAVVISNLADAGGLARARAAGIDAVHLDHRGRPSREAYDAVLAQTLRDRGVDLVCLAGFMRLIGEPLLEAYPHAILNVHPSLLPAFPGVNAQEQAVAHGVRVSGVTVHLVDSGLDSGPIVIQRAVPVFPADTTEALSARILVEEHRAYPEAAQLILDGGWRIEGRRFIPPAS